MAPLIPGFFRHDRRTTLLQPESLLPLATPALITKHHFPRFQQANHCDAVGEARFGVYMLADPLIANVLVDDHLIWKFAHEVSLNEALSYRLRPTGHLTETHGHVDFPSLVVVPPTVVLHTPLEIIDPVVLIDFCDDFPFLSLAEKIRHIGQTGGFLPVGQLCRLRVPSAVVEVVQRPRRDDDGSP